jgi:hypothetical protein
MAGERPCHNDISGFCLKDPAVSCDLPVLRAVKDLPELYALLAVVDGKLLLMVTGEEVNAEGLRVCCHGI